MLIISRKPGEGFWIDDETEVIVIGHQGSCIKLGVRAPRNVRIVRTELKLVQKQNEEASGSCSESSIDSLAARLRGAKPPSADEA